MSHEISIANHIPIRDAGFDEYWLQDQIWSNPASLGLGDLDALQKERPQNSGGRVDILLKDPQDDSMYEVEVMLGETDETHIIRTIEYWDNEKRRWPKRQHYAVLVAESITRRFFNVIHLISHSIPIIAIQVAIIESNDHKSLYFTKVLDTYEEVDDGSSIDEIEVNREFWNKKAKSTVDVADTLLEITGSHLPDSKISYVKNYVALNVGRNNYFWLHKRSGNKSLLGFKIADHLADEAESLLDNAKISFTKKPKKILITVDQSIIQSNSEIFITLASLVKRTWEKTA
ncbi:hypothetical protein ICN11_00105 [Polynucleobacter sp. 78F-HAINBA]|jgi:hypothetical protein|uniref:hypothetical protein n=1 Tax=Polynucleobacter sp. 78F-HAINBA TaxID=2689099 RepID=UPI001C0D2A98|nr:hypothetical protein [Polynucleobacter sp. 78F-HAINBA]MBU3590422.1 hypothetical protein [Polynucleobacter sp. 78F-HAINBA]